MKGETIRSIQWVYSSSIAVCVEVDAVRPDDEPGEIYLSPATIRQLEHLQELADKGELDELAKHGAVYVRRSA